MRMHCLSGGRVRMRKSVFLPDADRSETVELPVAAMLLRHAQGNVLFDTGCHPSVAEDPAGRWGGMAKLMTPIMPPGDNVLTGLACVGVTPDDIDVVVCSHLHPDHCGCNAFDQLSGERDLFGDGRIVLIPLPGHTPGSIGALVTLENSGTFLLAADTVSLRATLDRNVAPRNTQNPDALLKSWEEIRRVEARGATVLCGHDAAQWDTLRKGTDFYD